MREPASLTVVFVDRSTVVSPHTTDGLTFGRGADLDLDSNPFMHRRVGRFVSVDGVWWLENLSAWTPLSLAAGGVTTVLDGASRVALSERSSLITFAAGQCRYELHAILDDVPALPPRADEEDGRTLTLPPRELPLTAEQRLMVVALAEPRLRSSESRFEMPTNRDVARRLGWTDAKFNRKLDYLCRRLDGLGVPGLRTPGRRARDRRVHLVEHLLAVRAVTVDDLALLAPYPDVGAERTRNLE